MPSENRPGTGYGTAAFPENAVLRKLRGLLPGRGEPPAPGQGTGQNPGVPACGAEEVFVSLSCYRSALRSAQKLCLILAGFAAAGLITGLCAILARPEPVYFGMSQDMKLLPMTPLDKPVMNEAALKNWVAGAISASFNFDYLNWRSQLTDLRPYFTVPRQRRASPPPQAEKGAHALRCPGDARAHPLGRGARRPGLGVRSAASRYLRDVPRPRRQQRRDRGLPGEAHARRGLSGRRGPVLRRHRQQGERRKNAMRLTGGAAFRTRA